MNNSSVFSSCPICNKSAVVGFARGMNRLYVHCSSGTEFLAYRASWYRALGRRHTLEVLHERGRQSDDDRIAVLTQLPMDTPSASTPNAVDEIAIERRADALTQMEYLSGTDGIEKLHLYDWSQLLIR